MARIKYYYDTETCRYERVKVSKSDVFINALGIVCLCLVFGAGIASAYMAYFPSEKELALMKQKEKLEFHFTQMSGDLKKIQGELAYLQKKDDDMYRVIYEAEPIPPSIRAMGTGGVDKYKDILNDNLDAGQLVLDAKRKLDLLNRQMLVQTKSYDEIAELVKDKAIMLASIPAIQPISNKDLKRFASGFGYRIHPIYKVRRLHTGVDFTAPTGTPIFSSGDGKIVKVEKRGSGYGWQVEVDHGYNYITKYAHMSRIDVRVGEKIKRGQVIGAVGSTGTSTAPHLHYEVIYKGQKVNPKNYFFNDLSPKQYEELTKLATIENQAFDGD